MRQARVAVFDCRSYVRSSLSTCMTCCEPHLFARTCIYTKCESIAQARGSRPSSRYIYATNISAAPRAFSFLPIVVYYAALHASYMLYYSTCTTRPATTHIRPVGDRFSQILRKSSSAPQARGVFCWKSEASICAAGSSESRLMLGLKESFGWMVRVLFCNSFDQSSEFLSEHARWE